MLWRFCFGEPIHSRLNQLDLVYYGMKTVNMHEAKTHLSRLVERAARGESFVIARAGKPLVKVVPLDTPDCSERRRLGFMVGEIQTPDDFDTMGAAEFERFFEGRS